MTYELFSYPACRECEELKAYLKTTGLEGQEHNLAHKDGKIKIREHLSLIRRDEQGGMILPILVLKDAAGVKAVLQSREEAEAWLKSRA
ncbi:MAG: hypothetical protein JW747_09480 [Candidatus Aminicenantes bacterium]|nr:hypothetical protein [Candidatus Aminicenantes bacterium]